MIPFGQYRLNEPVIPTGEYQGHLWAEFLRSGTVEEPVNLLFVDTDYLRMRGQAKPDFESGDFAYDFFGIDSAATENGIGSEKTLYGVEGDPVSGNFAADPFEHKWLLDFFHQYWFEDTYANKQGNNLFFTSDGQSTGVRCDGAGFKTVFLPWQIEYILEDTGTDTVPSQEFRALVRNILEWFGTEKATGIEDPDVPLAPQDFELLQNYPNPFNSKTVISFRISSPSSVQVALRIYNILGQEVAILVDDRLAAGLYSVTWNGSDVSSGIYFYRITAGDFTAIRRMVLMK